MHIDFKRCTSSDPDFQFLVRALDADLAIRDGDEHSFYAQFNKIDSLQHCLVAYSSDEPVATGAIKHVNAQCMEIKRMFVIPALRGKGIAYQMLKHLEIWASEMHYQKCILETGKKQPEALRLYEKSGYTIIPNYDQYIGKENSVCFAKIL